MELEKHIEEKLNDLIENGDQLKRGNKNDQAFSEEHIDKCKGWITSANNLIEQIIDNPENPYRKTANSYLNNFGGWVAHRRVGSLNEILKNLREDINRGLISSILDQARAEVFDDFLDHAKHYESNGNKDEAGVISGVVFEDSLRRICRKNSINEKDEKIDLLISKLVKKNVLTKTKAKRARVSADVRTKATHAQWDEFDLSDVKTTIKFTEELILNHLE